MALWKEPTAPATPTTLPPPAPREGAAAVAPIAPEPKRAAVPRGEPKESLISADLTIEGKIEGAGSVRIAGSFKGDVHVQGDVTIEVGSKVTGQVRARTVIVAGELHGNIEGATRVELLESGAISGDVKAGTLTVAAGSRMRGQVDFGWEDKPARAFGGATDAKVS
jgi:cytoskeletal protein CcmA (bactofilin family)